MSYTRVTETPIHHVFAELAAFPLASPDVLRNPVLSLGPIMCNDDPATRSDPATARLWRDAERYLLRSGSAFSVEELVSLRDELWFDLYHDPRQPLSASRFLTSVPLVNYVRRLAERCLECGQRDAAPRQPFDSRPGSSSDVDARESSSRRDWRWVSFALPPDFLLATHPKWNRLTLRVELLSPWLRKRMADHGFAQSHVHMKGDFDFALLWARVADAIGRADPPESVGHSPGAELDDGRDLGHFVIRTILARYLLAWYLQGHASSADPLGFERFLDRDIRRVFQARAAVSDYVLLLDALAELRNGRLYNPPRWHELQSAYRILRQYHEPIEEREMKELNDVYAHDPLSVFYPTDGLNAPAPEMQFLADALTRLEMPAATAAVRSPFDALFARLFWQTVRVRNLAYRHVVQRPQTPGLQWFLRFYNRIRPLMGKLSTDLYVESAAHFGGVALGLRSLEVRTGIEEDSGRMLAEIGKIRSGWKRVVSGARRASWGFPEPEFGLVLHFIRDRRGGTLKGLPNRGWEKNAADPTLEANHGFRYADYYGEARNQALALGQVFRQRADTLRWVRGLDICTDELGIPTWVLCPLLRYVRSCASQARDQLHRAGQTEVPPLKTSIHAGEDFVHLLTGLRNMHQSIVHFGLGEGDRIGHGLALGVDPQRWSAKSNRVPMTIECRLRDLVWELAWYLKEGTEPQTGRWHWVEEEICRLSEEALGRRVPWQTLYRAHEHLLDEETLSGFLGFPDNPLPPAERRRFSRQPRRAAMMGELPSDDPAMSDYVGDSLSVAYRYLTDAGVFHRSHQVVWVNHLAEAQVVTQLQRELRKKVCEAGLTIEVNPTSNLLVGDFHDLVHHPLWRLKPPRSIEGLPPVPLCIGSDDPLNFATTLPEEFQFVLDAAILAGLSHDDAHAWLDEVRKAGLAARFTVVTPDEDDDLLSVTAAAPRSPP